jgi:hypothetical protein
MKHKYMVEYNLITIVLNIDIKHPCNTSFVERRSALPWRTILHLDTEADTPLYTPAHTGVLDHLVRFNML